MAPGTAGPQLAVQGISPAQSEASGVGLFLSAALVILLLAGAAGWYVAHRRSRAPQLAPAAAAVGAETPVMPQASAPTGASAGKPSAFPEPATVANPDAAGQAPVPARETEVRPRESGDSPVGALPEPVPVAAPPAQPAPPVETPQIPVPAPASPPRSGELHYSGPPVPQNGQVMFDNLPGARLKFTFDQQAWQPTIRRQPNGTQTLTLRSLWPGIETQCDRRHVRSGNQRRLFPDRVAHIHGGYGVTGGHLFRPATHRIRAASGVAGSGAAFLRRDVSLRNFSM
jgi:hypothetical protein